jgi:hypothetical protein
MASLLSVPLRDSGKVEDGFASPYRRVHAVAHGQGGVDIHDTLLALTTITARHPHILPCVP